jgi:hypothetical protein|tara:strand:- start:1616 stop:1831 length:216 start_codon:yes stop_codon:yes gene_type:complete
MTGTEDLIQQYRMQIKALQSENNVLSNNNERLHNELEWFRTYGQYISKVFNNVDQKACEVADENQAYQRNF